MPVNLKNYTSEVPAGTSIMRLEQKLVQAGASDINKTYEHGVCKSIRFRMLVNGNPVFFELPAKVDKCFKVFWDQRTQKTEKQKPGVWAQAERTAWKIISDWVDIQLSMIMLEQADAVEIFLPYVYNPETGKTFYSVLKETNFKMLTNGQ